MACPYMYSQWPRATRIAGHPISSQIHSAVRGSSVWGVFERMSQATAPGKSADRNKGGLRYLLKKSGSMSVLLPFRINSPLD